MPDIKVRTKFPLVEPEKPEPPPPPRMTLEQVNALILQDLQAIGVNPPEKCHTCEKLGLCATLFILGINPHDLPQP